MAPIIKYEDRLPNEWGMAYVAPHSLGLRPISLHIMEVELNKYITLKIIRFIECVFCQVNPINIQTCNIGHLSKASLSYRWQPLGEGKKLNWTSEARP